MTIEFQYTFDDFREATLAYGSAVRWQRAERASKQRKPSVVIGSLAFAFATMGIMLLKTNFLRSGFQKFNPFDLILPFGAILFFLLFARMFTPRVKNDGKNTRLRVGIAGVIVFVAVLGIFLMMRSAAVQPKQVVAPGETPPAALHQMLLDTATSHFVWLALLVLLGWLAVNGNRTQLQRGWEATPHLHRDFKADITGEHIVLETPVSKQEFRWTAFTRFEETDHLFLLGVSASTFHMIPKRAFADDALREAFRNIARGQIRNIEDPEQKPAFTVLQTEGVPNVSRQS